MPESGKISRFRIPVTVTRILGKNRADIILEGVAQACQASLGLSTGGLRNPFGPGAVLGLLQQS
jgi:hypothetical protein